MVGGELVSMHEAARRLGMPHQTVRARVIRGVALDAPRGTRSKPRKTKGPRRAGIFIRVYDGLLDALDTAAKRRPKKDGRAWTRQDVVRGFLEQGLENEGFKTS